MPASHPLSPFIPPELRAPGQDDYTVRNEQFPRGSSFRPLTPAEREELLRQGNQAEDWAAVRVEDPFVPARIQHCRFAGLVRIGAMNEPFAVFNDLRRPAGLYDSYIDDCDFGPDVLVDHVGHLSRTIVEDGAILLDCGEISTHLEATFGMGVAREGQKVLPWVEVWNENGKRAILPFPGMLSADAWLWAKYRGNEPLMRRFEELTSRTGEQRWGGYSVIGARAILQNVHRARNVRIGPAAFIFGAHFLRDITVQSRPEAPVLIGIGTEISDGLIEEGCLIQNGASAMHFVLGSHSTLRLGARFLHSFLGDNSTVACCEVLHCLIFPFHEQHHNNSFLIASCIEGQSNIAAGATIGSNHNSRSPDGELVARRGFWPGLCTSFKHNSRFASYTILSKGAYPAELNLPLPFSLLGNDETNGRLTVMPAYWPLYNMYALARNGWKYAQRDKRVQKDLALEFDFLAPDTVEEIFEALHWLDAKLGPGAPPDSVELANAGLERSQRPVLILKPARARQAYREMIHFYAMLVLMKRMGADKTLTLAALQERYAGARREPWVNLGGQLAPKSAVEALCRKIVAGELDSWDAVHAAYREMGESAGDERARHAWASLRELDQWPADGPSAAQWAHDLEETVRIARQWAQAVRDSRAKDYTDPFRQITYEDAAEMQAVLGTLEENAFVQQMEQQAEFVAREAAEIRG